MPTYQIYSSQNDGDANYQKEETVWSTARNDSSASFVYSSITATAKAKCVFNRNANDDVYNLERGFFYFDTSTISSSETIDSGSINFYISTQSSDSSYVVIKGTQGTPISVSDYDQFDRGVVYSRNNSPSFGYNSDSISNDGLNDIDISGTTKICVQEANHDFDDVTPASGTTYDMNIKTGESSDKPYLELTTSAPGTIWVKQSGTFVKKQMKMKDNGSFVNVDGV